MSDLTSLVAAHSVMVCVGSGGVGKTTIAAALALWGALHGRQTAVVTIDPAKRLARCLGLTNASLGEEPIPAEIFAQYGLNPSGTLTALLVDQQSAWDAAVRRYAPNAEVCERILGNRFYQGLSRSFAGSHEYMALDTLATLVQRNAYDLIVVDTPPTRQAIDFLTAPQRLQRFLDSKASKWFFRPPLTSGWAAVSAMNRTATFFLRKIEEATGISTLGEISEFFTAMQRMFEDFGDRFTRVSTLLASETTAFVLVTSPAEEVLTEAEEFRAGLAHFGVTLKGVVVNRVHEEWHGKRPSYKNAAALVKRLHHSVHFPSRKDAQLEWLVENFAAHQALARGEALRLERFRRSLLEGVPLVRVPAIPVFPADLSGLLMLHDHLLSQNKTDKSRSRVTSTSIV
jgi:anion-transporting  ArsA/GET3 family ATPase